LDLSRILGILREGLSDGRASLRIPAGGGGGGGERREEREKREERREREQKDEYTRHKS
jgi:hypothetical protein